MPEKKKFTVTFWGVRGSYPQCRADFMKVGGHTSCVSVEADDEYLLLDAGTGLIDAGDDIQRKGIKKATLLISHPHADHISGLGFFKPLHDRSFSLSLIGGESSSLKGQENGIEHILSTFVSPPYFPVPWHKTVCRKTHQDIEAGARFFIGNLLVSTFALNHPGGSCGYRMEFGNKSLCYITDTAPIAGEPDHALINFISRTDLLIYDAMFTEEVFKAKPHWGHSTWNEAVALAKQSEAGALALFHHSPDHDDACMDDIETQAQAQFPRAFVARQGMVWRA